MNRAEMLHGLEQMTYKLGLYHAASLGAVVDTG